MENKQSPYQKEGEEPSIGNNPCVTIITPVLNGVKYLVPCIESVLSQSYPNVEHIFIDGKSTDGTVDVLSSFSSRYSGKVRYISEPDESPGLAANKGIIMAKGEILGFIGADDVYEPGAIEKVIGFFKANPGAQVMYGNCNLINENGEIIGRTQARDFNLKKMINGTIGGPGPSTFYSRAIFDKIGLFDALVSELDFMIRAGKVTPIYRIDDVLCNFRVHKGSLTTGSWERRKNQVRDHCTISRRHGGSIFSGYCRLYYAYVIIDWLRPILGSFYPFIGKMTGKNIGKSRDDWSIKANA